MPIRHLWSGIRTRQVYDLHLNPAELRPAINARANELWVEAGRPLDRSPNEFWLEAEKQFYEEKEFYYFKNYGRVLFIGSMGPITSRKHSRS